MPRENPIGSEAEVRNNLRASARNAGFDVDNEVEEAVDLDLTAEDERLREAVGEPIKVKIDGVVIHIRHTADWNNAAMRAASAGDWDAWATEVIDDEDELDAFIEADLKNYQYEAIFDECGKQSGANAKKLRGSRRSSRRMPTR
jgi:hypothetical protein